MKLNFSVISAILVLVECIRADLNKCASSFVLEDGYNRHLRPDLNATNVYISLLLNRVPMVEERKMEVTLDAFVELSWIDKRITIAVDESKNHSTCDAAQFVELKIPERHKIWIPDLFSNQFRELKIRKHFQEISSIHIFPNSTVIFTFGAIIATRCSMNFALYPLDVQRCSVDIGSYKYSSSDIIFNWKTNNSIMYSKLFDSETYRLPKYVVGFQLVNNSHLINFDGFNRSVVQFKMTLWREMLSFLVEIYLPSTLFVILSWGTFFVNPEIVPGRMVPLINFIYGLVKMFGTVRGTSPKALEVKCLEVWILVCLFFVFAVLYEFFFVLFGIRYRKCFRNVKEKMISDNSPNLIQDCKMQSEGAIANCGTFSEENLRCRKKTPAKKLRKNVDKAILFVGAQRGKVDQIAVIAFPCCFIIFSIIYWSYYLTAAAKKELK